MKIIYAAALIALVGCSTYSETQSRAPLIELHTTKDADAYLGCVAPVVVEKFTASVIPDGSSRVLTATGAGAEQVIATITVTPSGDGSDVSYRQIHDLTWNAFGVIQEAVRNCQ